MRTFVITTGKGDVYTTIAMSAPQALTKFRKLFPGLALASIIESEEF